MYYSARFVLWAKIRKAGGGGREKKMNVMDPAVARGDDLSRRRTLILINDV